MTKVKQSNDTKKQKAIAAVIDKGMPITNAAKKYGFVRQTLSVWVKEAAIDKINNSWKAPSGKRGIATMSDEWQHPNQEPSREDIKVTELQEEITRLEDLLKRSIEDQSKLVQALNTKRPAEVFRGRVDIHGLPITDETLTTDVDLKPTNKWIGIRQGRDFPTHINESKNFNPISKPYVHTCNKIETLDFIADKELDYILGRAVSLIIQSSFIGFELKVRKEHLQKAAFLISRKIDIIDNKIKGE